MRILFLAHRIPFPPHKGDKIRSFHEIRYLSRFHDIYLGTILEEESDRRFLPELERYCSEVFAVRLQDRLRVLRSLFTGSPFSVAYFYDKKLQKFVDRVLGEKRVDAVICFCSSMAEYVFRTPRYRKNALGDTRLIMDYVDLDSDKWLQYSKYCSFRMRPIYRIEHRKLRKYEKRINRSFDHSIFVARREIDIFLDLCPDARNVHVILNGVDSKFFTPGGKKLPRLEKESSSTQYYMNGSHPILLFTGIMNYFANEDGVDWFCRKIFPIIKRAFPHTEFQIVGNKPSDRVWALTEWEGVTVTGYVEDIRSYYHAADICVIPLRIARGLQNKVLEAMATGKAVVATSNASDGIICRDRRDILIADDAESIANAVIELLMDAEKRELLGRSAVENIRSNYSWESNLSAFNAIFRSRSSAA